MAAQVCKDTSEAVELCPAKGLYLKPVAKITIVVGLPEIREVGINISNWEVMEKVKSMVAPAQFSVLRVVESSLEKIRFEAEVDTKSLLSKLVAKLEGNMIKLSGLAEPLQIRAFESKIKYPVKHDWESFFRDARNLNEWKPGERPDTIHLKGLPSKWFSSEASNKPSKEVIVTVFECFGKIRCVDIPSLDPYRARLTTRKHQPHFQTFCFGSDLHFEVYIQFEDYQGFVNAMKGLQGKKLLLLHESDVNNAATATIQFDFDKTCHLSESNIKKRNTDRDFLIEYDRMEEKRKKQEKEEEGRRMEEERQKAKEREQELLWQIAESKRKREERRKEREERRRKKQEEKKRVEQERKERERELLMEKKRIESMRELQARNLFTELFQRIAVCIADAEKEKRKHEEELAMWEQIKKKKQKLEKELQRKEEEEKNKKEKMEEDEKQLRDKLLKNLEVMKERKAELEREILRKQIQGKTKIMSVVNTNT